MKVKKIFGILLTLAMVIGLLPGMCLTAYAVDYDIWVGEYSGVAEPPNPMK